MCIRDRGWKDQLTEYDGQTITYDAIGNPLSYRDGMVLGWQHGRELKSLTAGGRTTTYSYDEDGYRMTKADESGVTRYYRNGTTLLTQKKGSTRLDFFYDANGLPLGFKKNGTVYYYILNLQGDVVGILDSEGTQVAGSRMIPGENSFPAPENWRTALEQSIPYGTAGTTMTARAGCTT